MNAEWLRSTGLQLDDVLGASIIDLFPETRDMALAMHARARAGHRVQVPRHARHLHGARTWWEGSIEPVPMEGGNGLLISARELTVAGRGPVERKTAEVPAQLLARFPEENPDPVVRLSATDFAVVYANPAARRLLADLGVQVGAPAPEALAVAARRALDERRHIRAELDSGSAVYSVSVVPVGEDLNVYCQDVTARKLAEEALRTADRRKDEFLAVLSHELRNPLAPIRNCVTLLERVQPGSEQAIRALEILRRQTDHITRLVDDLLDVSRISRGKVSLQLARVDLRDVARKCVDDMRALFDRGQVEVRLDQPAGAVWVDADPSRISQVLGNLLHNSLKFTPPGGAVHVAVVTGAGSAELVVRDTGTGIEPAQLERMFQPFAQAEQGVARTLGGLGLGLSLARGIAELHGGTLRAHSEGPGRGAEFVVSLPLAAPAETSAAQSAQCPPVPAREILLIEDNVDSGRTLADLLVFHGHKVRVAHDARSGIAAAHERTPDVVLCDIALPAASGYEVARALRADPALAGTLLVALTGYAQTEDQQRATEAGFDAHLAKPARMDKLQALLRR